MLEELKRCNYLGNPAGIYLFAQISIVSHTTNISSVIAISSTPEYGNIKQKACLAYFEALGLISINEKQITSTKEGRALVGLNPDAFHKNLCKQSIAFLIDNDFLSIDALSYDPENNISTIKKSGFSLQMAVVRNYLIDVKALQEIKAGTLSFVGEYQAVFEERLRYQRKKITLKQLLLKQEIQEKQGRLAEEYIVSFEKKRLRWGSKAEYVKQISDLDVTAGYDIVSFESNESKGIDRYIEVKSYHSTPSFFWSENEVEIAKRLGEHYFLYLVDMEQYKHDNYEPMVIKNPSEVIFKSDGKWMLETASTKVTKL